MLYSPTKEIWEAIFKQSPIGIAFVSKEGKWLKVNDSLCGFFEYTEDEMLNRDFQSITHPEDLDSDVNMLRKLAASEINGYQMTKRYLTKTNKIFWARLTVYPIKDESDNIMHYVSHIQPLVNGEKLKMEQVNSKKIEVRPTIKFGEFVSDNWQWFLGICAASVIVITTLGVAVWGTVDKIDRWETKMEADHNMIQKFIQENSK